MNPDNYNIKNIFPRSYATDLCPLVSVTMEPHCAFTARTNLHDIRTSEF